MSEKKKPTETKKYERIYEDDDSISVWKYDTSKTITGPYEVEIKHKKKKV
jgi:hypothetical protein